MAYRFRPMGDDVDSCLFEILMLEPPEGMKHPDPPEPVHLSVEQSYTDVEELAWLGVVYDQDTGNLQLQQQGLKDSQGHHPGELSEARIRRFHLTLDDICKGCAKAPSSSNSQGGLSAGSPVHCSVYSSHITPKPVLGVPHHETRFSSWLLWQAHPHSDRPIKQAESMGYDSVWTAEAYGNDAVTSAAYVLAQTSKIRVGTAIMQMPARTPAMCAMTAMSLDQLSGGRFIVGWAPGPSGYRGLARGALR